MAANDHRGYPGGPHRLRGAGKSGDPSAFPHTTTDHAQPNANAGTELSLLCFENPDWLCAGARAQGPECSASRDASTSPGLWEVDAGAGAHTKLDLHMPSAFLVDAAAGPGANQLIYSTSTGLNAGSEIWTMNSQGGSQTRLLSLPGGARDIAGQFTWSPD